MGKLMIMMNQSCFTPSMLSLYHSTICIILIVCLHVCSWNLPGPDNYALQYADGVQTYITESVSHHDLCTNQCKYLSTPGDHVVKGRAHLEDIEQWTRVRCFYLRRQCCKPPFKMWITVLSALCDLCLFAEYLESRSKSLKMEPRSHNIINAIFFFLKCETD